MCEDPSQICKSVFMEEVSKQFDLEQRCVQLDADFVGYAPFIGAMFDVRDDAQVAKLICMTCCALEARALYRAQRPPGFPNVLPLTSFEQREMQQSSSPWVQLVRLFSYSLCWSSWDKRHPNFLVYAAGVMAHPNAPPEILNDRYLQRLFRPCPLRGLDGDMTWNSPERVAYRHDEITSLPRLWRSKGHPETPEQNEMLAEMKQSLTTIVP